MLKVKVKLNEPFPISLMNKYYLKESFLLIKYKPKHQTLAQFVDSLKIRKMFIFLFWMYYVEKY